MDSASFTERRQNQRFQAQEGAFVATKATFGKFWQILDISRDGLAFRYVAGGEELGASSGLDIVTRDTRFSLEGIPCQSISDCRIQDESFSNYSLRRHGVKFGSLTNNQRSRLDYFIQNFTQ